MSLPFKAIPTITEINGHKRPGWWKPTHRRVWDKLAREIQKQYMVSIIPKPVGFKFSKKKGQKR
jgi:hypothetical protein